MTLTKPSTLFVAVSAIAIFRSVCATSYKTSVSTSSEVYSIELITDEAITVSMLPADANLCVFKGQPESSSPFMPLWIALTPKPSITITWEKNYGVFWQDKTFVSGETVTGAGFQDTELNVCWEVDDSMAGKTPCSDHRIPAHDQSILFELKGSDMSTPSWTYGMYTTPASPPEAINPSSKNMFFAAPTIPEGIQFIEPTEVLTVGYCTGKFNQLLKNPDSFFQKAATVQLAVNKTESFTYTKMSDGQYQFQPTATE